MSSVDRAFETQMKNIQTKTGKSLEELGEIIRSSGLTRHGELRTMLMEKLGLGYGDATMLIHYTLKTDGQRAAEAKGQTIDDVVAEIYSGAKAHLRPIHDKLMAEINTFGEFEIAPKKGYVSLRRKRQFAMIGPGTNKRVDLGINVKGLEPSDKLIEMPKGSMCNYQVRLTDASEVDEQVFGWIRQAYENAG